MIAADEIWEGEVRAGGSIVVAPGATLTLAAGARVVLAPGSRIQVRGRLVAAGAEGAPVVIESEGGTWDGVSVIGEGSVALARAILRGMSGDGLSFGDGARGECVDCEFSSEGRFALNHRSSGTVALARCAVSGARIGLSAFGGPLEVRSSRFAGQAELSLELSCEARLDDVSAEKTALGLKVVGGSVRASGLSLSARDGAKVVGASSLDWSGGSCAVEGVGLGLEGGQARVGGVAFSGGARGVSVESGRCAAAQSSFRGQSGAGVWCGEGGSLELGDCELSGSPTGVGARAAVSLTRCRFSGHAEQALDLHGAGHRVLECAVSDSEVGAAVSGRAEFSGVALEARRHAVVLNRGARLDWTGGLASSGKTALLSIEADAALRDLNVSGGDGGALVRGGRFSAAACAFERHAAAALELDGGEHELGSSRFSDCGSALVVAAGSCRADGVELSARESCVVVRRGAALAISNARLSGGSDGAVVEGGRLEARACAWERQESHALLCSDASVALFECKASGARKGLSARGGDVSAEGCSFADQEELGLEISCDARLERVSAASRALALRLSGGSLRAVELVLSGAQGAEVVGDSRLSWTGGKCAAELLGLEVEGGEAELRGVVFKGGRAGARLGRGKLDARDCSFEDQESISLELADAALLTRVAARCRGLALKIVGGETEASDVDIVGKDGAKVVGAARLRWRGGRCAAERVGLGVEGGEVELRGVRFSGGERGVSVESGVLVADGAVWEGQGLVGLAVGEGGRARLDSCSTSGAPTGASARGPVALTGCRLRGHAAQGVDLHGEGHTLDDCELAECGVGAALDGEARFSNVTASARRHAAALAPGARLEWRGGVAAADGIAFFSRRGEALLEKLRCEGGEGGALIESGRLAASRCGFEGGGAALELRGGEHDLSEIVAKDCDTGLVVSDGACRARSVELSGRVSGLLVRERGTLAWTGGSCEGARALVVAGGTARVEDASCVGRSEAVRLEGGALSARRLRVLGGSECGVLVDGGAFCELADCSVEAAPLGVAALSGHVHLLEGARFPGCARPVAADPAARLCLRRTWDDGSAKGVARPLLDFVLATKDSAPWRGLYWLAYAAGAAWLKLRLAAESGVEAARLHRGWITGDWQPGVSDLDALVVARDLAGEEGSRRLRGLWRRYAAWKSAVPFLGEVLIAERADFEAFVREGGARAETTARALGLPARDGDDSGDLIECAHAYTRLLQCSFSPRERWERNARHAAKAFLDVMRYGPLSEGGRPALSRRAAADEARRRGWTSRVAALEALGGSEPRDRTVVLARAAAEALSAFDERLGEQGAVEPSEANVKLADSEAIGELRASFGPAMTGALVDELYRSYVVLDERGARPDELAQSLAAAARRRPLLPGTLPVPLTRRLWRAVARSSYLEDPTRGLGFDDGRAAVEAGRLLPGVRQVAWGECRRPVAASKEDARSSARAAAANLALTWRWLGAAPGDARAVYHYLLGRALGLRLMLEKDIALPFFELDALTTRCAREFPELDAPLRNLEPLPENATSEEAFFRLYPFVDGQVRRLVQDLNDPLE